MAETSRAASHSPSKGPPPISPRPTSTSKLSSASILKRRRSEANSAEATTKPATLPEEENKVSDGIPAPDVPPVTVSVQGPAAPAVIAASSTSLSSIAQLSFFAVIIYMAQRGYSIWVILPLSSLYLYAFVLSTGGGNDNETSGAAKATGAAGSSNGQDQSFNPVFLNHALSQMWSMVNEDLFLPVIDLLEDALAEECPPIIHSNRVTTLSIGKLPMKIHKLRPMEDREWFQRLENGKDAGSNRLERHKIVSELVDGLDRDDGQYVNFEVDFEMKSKRDDGRPLSADEKAYLLVYFGVGVKGLGGVEMPVWIDLLAVKGTLHLRLLLDPSPPFVRSAQITLPAMPTIEISARPLTKKGGLDAMAIPGLRQFVLGSIKSVAGAFVSPESYALDLDRMLLGLEGTVETHAIGVLKITLHSASGLRPSDTNGFSDPYASISFGNQIKRPLFSTRTLSKTLDPVWDETVYLLVDKDIMESDQGLIFQIFDADRITHDDLLGGLYDLDLINILKESGGKMDERSDLLRQPGSNKVAQGELTWSVGFFRLWQIPCDEILLGKVEKKIGATNEKKPTMAMPIFHMARTVMDSLAPDKFHWEKERIAERKKTVGFLTGQRARQALEAAEKPSPERPAGIIQFTIHQCDHLLLRQAAGKSNTSSKDEVEGKPALAELVDSLSTDIPDIPVSAYCEIILNDRLIFRTRTKKLNSSPYYNAVTERFIRDWSTSRVKVVIRDERDREHNPILGMINIEHLGDLFSHGSQVTRWFPLSSGIGFGKIRLSFLFKALDIPALTPGISDFEVGTLEVLKLSLEHIKIPSEQLSQSSMSLGVERDLETFGSELFDLTNNFSILIDIPPVALATQYRHSSSLILRLFNKSGGIKKKTTILAMGLVRLAEVKDNTDENINVPLFAVPEISEATSLSHLDNVGTSTKFMGWASVGLKFTPGVGASHKHLVKGNERLSLVYEAWALSKLPALKSTPVSTRNRASSSVSAQSGGREFDLQAPSEGEEISLNSASLDGSESGEEDEKGDKPAGWWERRKGRADAKRKSHEGVYSSKSARSAIWAKDRVSAKISSMGGNGQRERTRGTMDEVEKEGISRL